MVGRKYIRPWLQNTVNSLLFNGVIDFIYQGYLVLIIMALINTNEARIKGDYLWSEKLNSYFAIFWLTLSILFPFFMCFIYWVKIKLAQPLPELTNELKENK